MLSGIMAGEFMQKEKIKSDSDSFFLSLRPDSGLIHDPSPVPRDPFHPPHGTNLSKWSQNENVRPLLYCNMPPVAIEKCFRNFDLTSAVRRKVLIYPKTIKSWLKSSWSVHCTNLSKWSQNKNVRPLLYCNMPPIAIVKCFRNFDLIAAMRRTRREVQPFLIHRHIQI